MRTIQTERARHHPVVAKKGMAVSQEVEATQVDGGGQLLAWVAESGKTVALEYREQSPGAARREQFW